MKKKRKKLLKIIIGSSLAAVLTQALILTSIWGTYNCQAGAQNCGTFDQATIKITIGLIILFVCWGVFLASTALFIWYSINKKSK